MAVVWQGTSTVPDPQSLALPRRAWSPVVAVGSPRALGRRQGSSTRGSLAALVRGSSLNARSVHRHLPASLRSTEVTRFQRYYGCSDSCTAALRPRRAGTEHRLAACAGLPVSRVGPSKHSAPNHLARSCSRFDTQPLSGTGVQRRGCTVGSGLRHRSAGSPLGPAETGSSSCGLLVHLPLLSTSPRGDAVTFSYRPESACLKRTSTFRT